MIRYSSLFFLMACADGKFSPIFDTEEDLSLSDQDGDGFLLLMVIVMISMQRFPNAKDTCDGIDNDCNPG